MYIIIYKKKVEKQNADDHKTTPNWHTNVAILWATFKAHKKDRFWHKRYEKIPQKQQKTGIFS